MLVELKISNFAIIHELQLEFSQGLNILSGETGAGKSVLLKGLALLIGEKAFSDTVRSGHDQALIEGFFDLEKRPDITKALATLEIETPDNTLAVRRIITAQGKSRVYLNGHLSTLNNLRDIVSPLITLTGHTAPLIEMTGQHENRNLQSKAYHLDILDAYTGSFEKRSQVETIYNQLRETKLEIERLESERRLRDQRLDFLRYQRDEISSLNLVDGEEESLEAQLIRLRHSSKLSDFVQSAQSSLYTDEDAVLVKLHQILQRAQELKGVDEVLFEKIQGLAQAKALVEDSVYELRDYGRAITANPEDLNRLEERLSQIRKLQKKFGGSIEDILTQLGSINADIEKLESLDDTLMALQKSLPVAQTQLDALCEELHSRRSNGALLLAQGVNEELEDLNMKGVIFGVQVDWLSAPTATGQSDIEFTIRPSKKDEPKSLAKVASGGELSRILLSLKRVVGHSDQPRTYLFDEVDTGVSGPTAEKVGRKLKSIARGQQVICVTHLPQVAAFADTHYVIEKSTGRSGAETKISKLGKSERIKEIARLISGEKITQTSLDHARQLLAETN